jgi:glycosyltransferase involved in cell wall biosynthesis
MLLGGHRVGIGVGVGVLERPGHDMTGWITPVDTHDRPVVNPPPELLVCQRWMHAGAADLTRAARRAGQAVVHDVDDWFWGLDPANRAHRTTAKRTNPLQNREHYAKAVAAADAVTCSTPFLEQRLRERFGVDTLLLRNAVDAVAFDKQPVADRDDRLVLGWVGALQWRSGDLETLAPWLDGWLARTGSSFVHNGTFPVDADTAAARAGVDPDRALTGLEARPPWSYHELVGGFDVGLVPLADVPFNRAKSWIKGLEYAAAGIPFVAAATPEYVELASRGAGTVADTPERWMLALDALLDPAERARQSERGLAVAKSQDWAARWTEWQTAYEGILARR